MTSLKRDINGYITSVRHELGENDTEFFKRVYGEGLEKYENRTAAIGFTGHASVLDAGCGFGQWSLALGMHNKHVSSCDVSPERVNILAKLAAELGFSNIDATVCRLETLPYDDNTFDAVFCYGVIFLTPWRQTLKEFQRVLQPSGKLYVNANGIGWYVFLWKEEQNKTSDYDPKSRAAHVMLNTLRYDREGIYEDGMEMIIEPEDLKNEMTFLGFKSVQIAPEGTLKVALDAPPPRPFFRSEYYGQTGVYEAMGSLNK